MGWLSNIFKQKKTDEKFEVQSVGLDEFIEILENKIKDQNAMVEDDLRKIHRDMIESSRTISKTLLDLKSSPGPSKVDERVMNVVSSYRSTVVSAFNGMFIEFGRPVKYTIDEFDDYFRRCSSSLSDSENKVNRFITPLKEVFPGSIRNLLRTSKNMDNIMSNARSQINSKLGNVRSVLDVLNLGKELDSHLKKTIETESEMEEKKSSLEEIKSKKKSLEEKLSEFERGDEWLDYEEKLEEARSIEKKKDEIRSVVLQTVAPLDKGMKKLKKLLSDDEESFENFEMLNLYIEDPVSAFLRDDNQEVINKIIFKIKELVESGKIEMDDKKGQKILEKISSMESENLLSNLIKDYKTLEERKTKLEEEVGSMKAKETKSGYERQLKDMESNISEKENDIKELNSSIDRMKEKKTELFKEIKAAETGALGERTKLKEM